MAQDVIIKAAEGEKVVRLTDSTDPKVPKVIVNFKAGKGSKYLKEGKTYRIHQMHADRLVAKKLGTIEK